MQASQTVHNSRGTIGVLPNELLFQVLRDSVLTSRDISSVIRTRRDSRLHDAAIYQLYKNNIANEGSSCLYWAAQKGTIYAVRAMQRAFAFGARPNMYALRTNPSKAKKEITLLTNDFWAVPPNDPRYTYATLLHIAAFAGYDDIVTILLDRGATMEMPSLGVCGCGYNARADP